MTVKEYDPNAMRPEDAVTLTPTALEHVKNQLKKRGRGIGLRLTTKKSGCAGFAYVIDLIDDSSPDDYQFPADTEIAIYVSAKDFPIVKGTQLDYVRQGLNSRFIFTNPNEAGSCGCGESFTVDKKDQ